MTPETSIQRDLGRLEAQVTTLTLQVGQLQSQVAVMTATIATATGGWKVMLAVGAASASVTALVAKLLGAFGK